MSPIEKCKDCDRWKLVYDCGEISDKDMVCSLCQATFALKKVNDHIEAVSVSIAQDGS